MEIRRNNCHPYNWRPLRNCTANCVVLFNGSFHQDNRRDDPFLVINDQAYSLQDGRGKRAVVNLRTGKLSLVNQDRSVRIVPAAVCIDE